MRFLAEVRVGQTVTLHSRVVGRSEKRIHFMHFMVDESGENVASTMEVLATHVDLDIRRSMPFPEDIAAAIDETLSRHDALSWAAPTCGAIVP